MYSRQRNGPDVGSIAEGVTEPDGGLCRLRFEGGSRDERVLAERDEELLTRLVFPAIAQRDTQTLADIVVLSLSDDLHIGCEIDTAADLQDVDRDMAGWEMDEGRDVARNEFEILVGAEGEGYVRFQVAAVVEAAAFDLPVDCPPAGPCGDDLRR